MVLALCGVARAGSESKPLALSYTSSGVTFANLPVLPKQINGTWTYCSDCAQANPCAGSGSGAVAMLINSGWDCSVAGGSGGGGGQTFPPSSNLSMGSHSFTSLGPLTGSLGAGGFGITNLSLLGDSATGLLLQGGAAGLNQAGSDKITGFSVNGVFNAMAYGATGTGTNGTDDASSIRNAVNAACSANNVSDSHVSATTVLLPAGSYAMSSPLWVNCAGLTLRGEGPFASVLSPTYDFGPTVLFAAKAYPGVPLATALETGPGSSFDFTQDRASTPFLNLREYDGMNGAAANYTLCTGTNAPWVGCTGAGTGALSYSGMNLNGLTALSVEYFFNQGTAGDGAAVASGSEQSISLGQSTAFISGIDSSDWWDAINLSVSGVKQVLVSGGITPGTTYYRAMTYDGSNLRQYACTPGGTSCAPIGTTAGTGTVVQGPTEDVTIGRETGVWPNGALEQTSVNGKIYCVRISNIARYTGTIATVPSACSNSTSSATTIGPDSNTLIMTAGEQPAVSPEPPFYKAYDNQSADGYGYGWLFGYSSNRAQSGNYFILHDGMRDVGITGDVDNSGIYYVGGHDSDFDSLYLLRMEVGIQTYQLSYEARNFSNITISGVPGRYGINDMGGGLNTWNNIKVTGFWAHEVANSGHFSGLLNIQGNNYSSLYGFVLNNLAANTPAEATLLDATTDAENTGNSFTPLYVLANTTPTVLNVSGGLPVAEDSAPAAVMDSGGTLNLMGAAVQSFSGSPTELVHVLGSGAPRINEEGVTRVSGFVGVPITTTAAAISCAGAAANGTICATTVATLPTCTATLNHRHFTVTDANSGCSAGTIPTGGGSISCDVYCAVPGH